VALERALIVAAMKKISILPVLLFSCWVVNASAEETTTTFTYTGSYQTFLVPENVTSISFTLIGASGGSAYGQEPASYTVSGGYGERVTGRLSVLPGQTLYVFVGGYGSDSTLQSLSPVLGGYNGGGAGLARSAGGGGGATDVRLGGIDLINRVAVAAGGGGANSIAGYGGGPGGVIEHIWGLNGVLGQGSDGNGGGGGGGYHGGVGGVYGYSRTSGAGGSSWGDSNLVSDLAFSQESTPAFTQVMGFASISYTIPEPTPTDSDNDGIPDANETNTGVYVSPTDTGTDPNNADTDGDGLSDGVETGTGTYVSATNTGTDPNILDSDGDGLSDSVETNTGVYVSALNTGTNPLNEDTSGDGITDGEAVTAQFNPLIDQRPVLNFLTQAVAAQPNRFGFYNESNVMHLGMGGLMIRKSGSVVNLDLQWQTKTSLTNAWTNHGAPLPFFLNLPGSKAFIRLQATPGAQ
jgi:hypothetical protein